MSTPCGRRWPTVVAVAVLLVACQSTPPPTERSDLSAGIARLLALSGRPELWTEPHPALVAVDLAASTGLRGYVAERIGAVAARRVDAALLVRTRAYTEVWLLGRFSRMATAPALRRAGFVRDRVTDRWTRAGVSVERRSRRLLVIGGEALDRVLPWLQPMPPDSAAELGRPVPVVNAHGSGAAPRAVATRDAELGPVIARVRSAALPPTDLPAPVLPLSIDLRLHQSDQRLTARVDLRFADERAARTALTVLRFMSVNLLHRIGVSVTHVPVERAEGGLDLEWGPVALTESDLVAVLDRIRDQGAHE